MYLIETNSVTPFGSKVDTENYLESLSSTKFKKVGEVRDEHGFIVDYFILSDRCACKGRDVIGKYFSNDRDLSRYLKEKYPRCRIRIVR